MKTFDRVYKSMMKMLVYDFDHQVAGTREVNNVMFMINNIEDPLTYSRDISIEYALAELIWYFAGSQSTEWIGRFASMWNRLTDDGVNSNSAYGHILKHRHGFNQIEKVIELLKKDPTSRRALININVPNVNVIETKDEPCTIALQFLIRDKKLHVTGMMRSNDIWFGMPYDIVYFTTLQKYIARALKLETGTYTHYVTSMHLYDRDYDKVKNIVDNKLHSNNKIKIDYLLLADKADELYEKLSNVDNPKKAIIDLAIQEGIIK